MSSRAAACHFFIVVLVLGGVFYGLHRSTYVPRHVNDICAMFKARPQWRSATRRAAARWHIPESTQMAVIWQESRFQASIKPRREWLLGVIPWAHPTSAVGYAQAIHGTWQRYLKATDQDGGSREKFAQATDFVAWYLATLHKRLSIPKADVGRLYLAYHEGQYGYLHGQGSHQRRLQQIARRVAAQARRYQRQLRRCRV